MENNLNDIDLWINKKYPSIIENNEPLACSKLDWQPEKLTIDGISQESCEIRSKDNKLYRLKRNRLYPMPGEADIVTYRYRIDGEWQNDDIRVFEFQIRRIQSGLSLLK